MTQTIIGIDIETSKSPAKMPWVKGYYLSIISLNYPNNTSRTWYFYHNDIKYFPGYSINFEEIQKEIDKYDIVAAHNIKFELNNLSNALTFNKIHCTMVAEYLLNYHDKSNLSLDYVSSKYGLPLKDDRVKAMWDSGMDTCEIPLSILQPYCEEDARKARIIAENQITKIKNEGMLKVFSLQMEWTKLLSEMECNGIAWDSKMANNIINKYKKYLKILESKIYKLCGPYINNNKLNLSSNDHLSILLYGGIFTQKEKKPVIKTKNIKTRMPYVFTYKDGKKVIKQRWVDHPDTRVIRMVYRDVDYKLRGLGITPLKKSEVAKSNETKPFYKTDKDTLPALKCTTNDQKTIVNLLIKRSSIGKVISTFLGDSGNTGLTTKIAVDGHIHTNYNQTITSTGRLSSSDPNNQNLPRDGTSPIKRCIIPSLHFIMDADLSQVEWRIPAQMSGDRIMIDEIKNGMDCHSENCKKLMLLPVTKLNRYHTKIFNFRMIFRGSAWGFHKDNKMPHFGIKRWKEIVEAFWNKYKGLDKWHQTIIKHVITGDGTLQIFTGRKFKFKLNNDGKYNESQISNSPVQGFAGGDLLPLCAVIIHNAMRKQNLKSFPILTVHDSVVFDTHKDEVDVLADLVTKVMNNLPTYIKSYFGYDWEVPLTGEVNLGVNYGETKQIR